MKRYLKWQLILTVIASYISIIATAVVLLLSCTPRWYDDHYISATTDSLSLLLAADTSAYSRTFIARIDQAEFQRVIDSIYHTDRTRQYRLVSRRITQRYDTAGHLLLATTDETELQRTDTDVTDLTRTDRLTANREHQAIDRRIDSLTSTARAAVRSLRRDTLATVTERRTADAARTPWQSFLAECRRSVWAIIAGAVVTIIFWLILRRIG